MPPENLDPHNDDRGAPDHRVKRLEGLLLAELSDPFDQEFQVGLDRTKIDVLGLNRSRSLAGRSDRPRQQSSQVPPTDGSNPSPSSGESMDRMKLPVAPPFRAATS